MESHKYLLAKNMAFLMLVSPDTNLAKLLKFCLATKVTGENPGQIAEEMARKLMEKPSNFAYWTQDVMRIDDEYTTEEWEVVGHMELTNIEEFMNQLWQELESLNL
ncbi:MAG: hypothetical protein F6K40_10795 [Okeania sp. SIO3I5]|uniref:hypothetical protein n=1 Tax=Okeania sp. SIO3I5 TaxID=2607805 RepID=UPI0013B76FAC|nr:hypothetical protein [Okeania sp. SIO3I5]NEQ36738.1 hypothetical protein [Okeania sp. SIO3I5]